MIDRKYYPEHEVLKNRIANIVKEFDDIMAYDDWNILLNTTKYGVTAWERTTSDGVRSLKSSFEVDKPMEDCLELLFDEKKYRHKYDPSFDYSRVL